MIKIENVANKLLQERPTGVLTPMSQTAKKIASLIRPSWFGFFIAIATAKAGFLITKVSPFRISILNLVVISAVETVFNKFFFGLKKIVKQDKCQDDGAIVSIKENIIIFDPILTKDKRYEKLRSLLESNTAEVKKCLSTSLKGECMMKDGKHRLLLLGMNEHNDLEGILLGRKGDDLGSMIKRGGRKKYVPSIRLTLTPSGLKADSIGFVRFSPYLEIRLPQKVREKFDDETKERESHGISLLPQQSKYLAIPLKLIGYKGSSSQKIGMLVKPYEHGDLFGYLRKSTITFDQKIKIFKDCLNGLIEMHAKGVAHLDIKLENILVGTDHQAALADFDTATSAFSNVTTERGTPDYMPPEVIFDREVNALAWDLWSMGITALMMFINDNVLLDSFKTSVADGQKGIDSFFFELVNSIKTTEMNIPLRVIQGLLQYDPSSRISAQKALELLATP